MEIIFYYFIEQYSMFVPELEVYEFYGSIFYQGNFLFSSHIPFFYFVGGLI